MAEKKYIELEALMNVPIRRDHYDKKNGDVNFINGIEFVLEYAEYLSIADVEPVRYGVWEREIGDTHSNGIVYYCTSCSKNIIMFNSNLMPTMKYSHPYVFELPKYCPNCGAKMSKT